MLAVRAPWGKKKPAPALVSDLDPLLTSHVAGTLAEVTFKDASGLYRRRLRLGAYSPAKDDTVKWLCLDLDGQGHANALKDPLAAALTAHLAAKALGLPSYLEKSGGGKGWHLWLFFTEPVPAALARQLGLALAPKDAPLCKGGVASPKASKGIEVFPKQDRLSEDGLGNLVWLPWWHGAPSGANVFYRPETLEPYLPEHFETASLCTLKDTLLTFPAPSPESKRPEPCANTQPKTPHHKPTSTGRGKDSTWGQWRQRALAALPLESVYGPYLTGRTKKGGWLECRDPASPTGDKHPSAGVADGTGRAERGRFSSHISGERLSVFDFLCRYGGCADERAAFHRVAELSGVTLPAPPQRATKKEPPPQATKKEAPKGPPLETEPAKLPPRYQEQWEEAKAREAQSPEPQDLLTLESLLRRVVKSSLTDDYDGLTVLCASLGCGKTQAAIHVLPELTGTIAIHVETHDLAREIYARILAIGCPVRRDFSGPGDGLLDEYGKPVCPLPDEVIQAEYGAGWTGPQICAQCYRYSFCKAAKGFEGTKDARIRITTHARPLPDSDHFLVDERPKPYETKKVTQSELAALERCQTIAPRQQNVLLVAAHAVLCWLNTGAQGDDPLAPYRQDLKDACEGGRAIVRRVPMDDLGSPVRERETLRDAPAWRAARWLLEAALHEHTLSKGTLKRQGKRELAALFRQKTRMAEALTRAKHPLLLDATATKRTLLELEATTGKLPRLIEIVATDGAPLERLWFPTTLGKRGYTLDDHGIPDFKGHLRTLLRYTAREIEARPDVHRLLLVTHRPITLALDLVWAARGHPLADPEASAAFARLFPKGNQELLSQRLQEAADALAPLFELLETRGGELGLAYFGALRGLDRYKDFQACVTLGDPFPSLDDHREARLWEARRTGQAHDPKDEWASYLEIAALELAQAHGRLRPPSRKTRAFSLHLGAVLPLDWRPSQTKVCYRPYVVGAGRQRNPASAQAVALLSEAIRAAGGLRALARALKVAPSRLCGYAQGKRAPSPELIGQLRAFLRTRGGVHELSITDLERGEDGDGAGGVHELSITDLERGEDGYRQFVNTQEGERQRPGTGAGKEGASPPPQYPVRGGSVSRRGAGGGLVPPRGSGVYGLRLGGASGDPGV